MLVACSGCCSAHALRHAWCAPPRRTARWSARSASTRPGCSPPCSRSARCWPAWAARCSCRASPPTWSWTCTVIGDAFVVVVVGGMGSIPGAYLAALLIAEIKAICIGIGVVDVRRLRVSILQAHAGGRVPRDGGGAGRAALGPARPAAGRRAHIRPSPRHPLRAGAGHASRSLGARRRWCCWRCCPCWPATSPYASVLGIDLLIAALFATSLHFIMGPGGMHSFGHAAYFGLGAYGARCWCKFAALPMELGADRLAPLVAAAGALLFGWFAVRLSGVYLAMLTLAFAQIVWPIVFQWENFTGGCNGVVGVWPTRAVRRPQRPTTCSRWCSLCAGVLLLRRMLFSPLRLCDARRPRLAAARRRDRHRRQARALDRLRHRRHGLRARRRAVRLRQGLHLARDHRVGRSVDGLVMVLLGGIQTLAGPIVGAATFTCCRTPSRANRLLARAARRHHPAAGAGVPAGHRRRASRQRMPRMEGARDERARQSITLSQVLRRRARAVDGIELRRAPRRAAGADRPQRRRQVHHLQHGQRPAAPDSGSDPARRTTSIAGLQAARDLAAGRRPHLPDRRDLRLDDGGRERADGAALARRRAVPHVAPRRRRHRAARRWRCWPRSAWPRRPTGPAASSPMATSSGSSWPSRWPTRPSCC